MGELVKKDRTPTPTPVPISEFDEAYQDKRTIRGAVFEEPLSKVPRRPMLVIDEGASVAETVRAMNERHVGCALVVRGEKLAGVFTERDVLTKIACQAIDTDRTKVSEVMTRNPETLPDTATIAYALKEMSVHGYRHIPIVDAMQRPVGVVAVRDIVGWMSDMFPSSILNLPPKPGFPKGTDGG